MIAKSHGIKIEQIIEFGYNFPFEMRIPDCSLKKGDIETIQMMPRKLFKVPESPNISPGKNLQH